MLVSVVTPPWTKKERKDNEKKEAPKQPPAPSTTSTTVAAAKKLDPIAAKKAEEKRVLALLDEAAREAREAKDRVASLERRRVENLHVINVAWPSDDDDSVMARTLLCCDLVTFMLALLRTAARVHATMIPLSHSSTTTSSHGVAGVGSGLPLLFEHFHHAGGFAALLEFALWSFTSDRVDRGLPDDDDDTNSQGSGSSGTTPAGATTPPVGSGSSDDNASSLSSTSNDDSKIVVSGLAARPNSRNSSTVDLPALLTEARSPSSSVMNDSDSLLSSRDAGGSIGVSTRRAPPSRLRLSARLALRWLADIRDWTYVGGKEMRPTLTQIESARTPTELRRDQLPIIAQREQALRTNLIARLQPQTAAAAAKTAGENKNAPAKSAKGIFSIFSSDNKEIKSATGTSQSTVTSPTTATPSVAITGATPFATIPTFSSSTPTPFQPRVRTAVPFRVLGQLAARTTSRLVRRTALDYLRSIILSHPENYLILRDLNALSGVVDMIDGLSPSLQQSVISLILKVVQSDLIVPYQEIAKLTMLLATDITDRTAIKILNGFRLLLRSSPSTSTTVVPSTTGTSGTTATTSTPTTTITPAIAAAVSAIGNANSNSSESIYFNHILRSCGILPILIKRITDITTNTSPFGGIIAKPGSDDDGKTVGVTGDRAELLSRLLELLLDLLSNTTTQETFNKGFEGPRFVLRLLNLSLTHHWAQRALYVLLSHGDFILTPPPSDEKTNGILLWMTRLLEQVAEQSQAGHTLTVVSLLHSIRKLCVTHSARLTPGGRAQDYFRLKGGFATVFAVIERLKIDHEVARRRALRRRMLRFHRPQITTESTSSSSAPLSTTSDGGETKASLSPSSPSSLSPSDIRAELTTDDAELDRVLLSVRGVMLTITTAIAGHQHNRTAFERIIGYDRLLETIGETESFAHVDGPSCVVVWLIWMGLESCIEANPDAPSGDVLIASSLPLRESGVLTHHIPVVSAIRMLHRCPLPFQVRILQWLKLLANAEVVNRALLGKVGFASVLIECFKDVLLASVDERHHNARYKELRMPVFFLLRVLLVFTPNAADVNHLFGLLDGSKWETIVDSFIRLVSHSQQNGRLWPYLHMDFGEKVSDGSCLEMERIRTTTGYWPPATGYTFACWICIDKWNNDGSVNQSIPLRLLTIMSDDNQSKTVLFLKNGSLTLRTSLSSAATFRRITFYPHRWYHLTVTHTRGLVGLPSIATMYVDGVEVQQDECLYITPASNQAKVWGYIGTPPKDTRPKKPFPLNTVPTTAAAGTAPGGGAPSVVGAEIKSEDDVVEYDGARSVMDIASQWQAQRYNMVIPPESEGQGVEWRIASCLFVEGVLPDATIATLYQSKFEEAGHMRTEGIKKQGGASVPVEPSYYVQAAETYHSHSRVLVPDPTPKTGNSTIKPPKTPRRNRPIAVPGDAAPSVTSIPASATLPSLSLPAAATSAGATTVAASIPSSASSTTSGTTSTTTVPTTSTSPVVATSWDDTPAAEMAIETPTAAAVSTRKPAKKRRPAVKSKVVVTEPTPTVVAPNSTSIASASSVSSPPVEPIPTPIVLPAAPEAPAITAVTPQGEDETFETWYQRHLAQQKLDQEANDAYAKELTAYEVLVAKAAEVSAKIAAAEAAAAAVKAEAIAKAEAAAKIDAAKAVAAAATAQPEVKSGTTSSSSSTSGTSIASTTSTSALVTSTDATNVTTPAKSTSVLTMLAQQSTSTSSSTSTSTATTAPTPAAATAAPRSIPVAAVVFTPVYNDDTFPDVSPFIYTPTFPKPVLYPSSSIPFDKILWFFHASNHVTAPARNQLAATAGHRTVFLLNSAQPPSSSGTIISTGVAHGEMRGATTLYAPRGMADSIRQVGGLRRLLPLLARCETSKALRRALLFLVVLLRDSPKNHREMESFKLYHLLSFLLKHRVHLIDRHIVDILFGLVGLADSGISGHIGNLPAFETILMVSSLHKKNKTFI
jgi:hypothetical protein